MKPRLEAWLLNSDLPYSHGEVDCRINSWTLSNGLWLGADADGVVTCLLDHHQGDGG